MRGLGLNMAKNSSDYWDRDRTWEEISGKILHWDFSDVSSLETPGGEAPSNGGNIGKVHNLSTDAYRMGNWGIGGGYPLYTTGGANGKSYALFDDCYAMLRNSNPNNLTF